MPRGRKKQQQNISPVAPKVWLRADYEFPSTFSYRQPGASAQFAVGVPIPSPSTVKLALVNTAIRWNGDIEKGKEIFERIKTCRVCVIPPDRIVRFRVFLRRLKPPHSSRGPNAPTEESTGVRDYFLFNGPLSIYIEVPQEHVDEISDLLLKIRYFGTSDSLCWCVEVKQEAPLESLCPKRLSEISRVDYGIVTRLADLTPRSQFDGFNPFGGTTRKAHLDENAYLIPLTTLHSAETWAILQRINQLKTSEAT